METTLQLGSGCKGCLPFMPFSLELSVGSLGKTIEETTLRSAPASSWEEGVRISGFSLGTHTAFVVTLVILLSMWL